MPCVTGPNREATISTLMSPETHSSRKWRLKDFCVGRGTVGACHAVLHRCREFGEARDGRARTLAAKLEVAPRRHDALPYRTPCSGHQTCIEATGWWRRVPRSRQSDRFWQSRPCGSWHDAVSYRGGVIVAARRTVASGCRRADQRRITSGWELSAASLGVTAPLIQRGLSPRRRLGHGTHGAVAVRAYPPAIRQPVCHAVAAA